MKRTFKVLILVLWVLVLSSCGTTDNNAAQAPVEDPADGSKYAGIYMYDYEYDSEKLKEDHYIVIETIDGKLEGRYYGTSDDFDEAREGYLPGFFVSDIMNLKITGDEITFDLELDNNIIFSKPVDLEYRSAEAVPSDENHIWENSHAVKGDGQLSRSYAGKITDGEIIMDMGNSQRVYKRLSNE